jgi:A/G-specific adenine glycosylase
MKFSNDIINWYGQHCRDLPWRQSRDPYLIWLSEVILQQTRVEQGKDYYLRFSSQYPDIESLANASEKDVLKAWQGLGYYSRARHLLQAARQIMDGCRGVFPDTYEQILKLSGVGKYTAAAIASIAFGISVPVVDGNVKRVMSRLFGIESTGSRLYREAEMLMEREMDPLRPGDFNQAVMEFGALQCVPAKPSCQRCIFNYACYAYTNNKVAALPVRESKALPRIRHFNYLVIGLPEIVETLIMKKRTENDIWKNLYDFPLIETDHSAGILDLAETSQWKSIFKNGFRLQHVTPGIRHQLTHRTIMAKFFLLDLSDAAKLIMQPGWERITLESLHHLPLPRLIERFIMDKAFLDFCRILSEKSDESKKNHQ